MKKLIILSVSMFLVMGVASFAQDMVDDSVAISTDNAIRYVAEKDRIGLTNDQVTQLNSIRDSLRTKNADLIKKRDELTRSIRDLVRADNPDYDQVSSKVRDLENVRPQIILNRLSAAKDANNVLTADQRSKLQQLNAERKSMAANRLQQMQAQRKAAAAVIKAPAPAVKAKAKAKK
jgi:Spy/CpxP family protein refolding chaperone